MSMVTLGDAVANTGLGWLVLARARIMCKGVDPATKHKLPVALIMCPLSADYEWVVMPHGFDHHRGFSEELTAQLLLCDMTLEQRVDMALATVMQWGSWAWAGRLAKLEKELLPDQDVIQHPHWLRFCQLVRDMPSTK
jgi:hypothetical protein